MLHGSVISSLFLFLIIHSNAVSSPYRYPTDSPEILQQWADAIESMNHYFHQIDPTRSEITADTPMDRISGELKVEVLRLQRLSDRAMLAGALPLGIIVYPGPSGNYAIDLKERMAKLDGIIKALYDNPISDAGKLHVAIVLFINSIVKAEYGVPFDVSELVLWDTVSQLHHYYVKDRDPEGLLELRVHYYWKALTKPVTGVNCKEILSRQVF